MCESLSQQRQRIGDEVELVRRDALAAVGCDGQRVPLSIDAEELQVEEAVSQPPLQVRSNIVTSLHCGGSPRGGVFRVRDTYGLQNGFAVSPGQHLQGGQRLLGHVDELDHLELQEGGERGPSASETPWGDTTRRGRTERLTFSRKTGIASTTTAEERGSASIM